MIPSSQQNKPISFILLEDGNPIAEQDLIIRPEEMTRQEPSRNNVQNTLGGAWIDSFGPGVASITLNGHTGWRGTASEDGFAIFKRLRETVFVQWHSARAAREQSLRDPDDVQLVFVDQLNDFASVVSPQQFQLRRHKSRSLLSQFQISLVELGPFDKVRAKELQDPIVAAIDNPRRQKLAQESVKQTVKKNKGLLGEISAGIAGLTSGAATAATRVLELSNKLLVKVDEIAGEAVENIDTASRPLLIAADAIHKASANAFAIMAMPSNIAAHAKHTLMRISGNLMDARCNLKNGFDRLFEFPDFSDVFGASMCSSTGGGRPHSPWAEENPFLRIFPATSPVVTIDSSAQSAIGTLSALDGVNTPGDQTIQALDRLNALTRGVRVA
jgi:hypothetical protein